MNSRIAEALSRVRVHFGGRAAKKCDDNGNHVDLISMRLESILTIVQLEKSEMILAISNHP